MKTIAQSLIAALLLSTATFAGTPATIPTASNPVVTTDSYKVAVYPSAVQSRLHVCIERQPGQFMAVYLKTTDGEQLGKKYIRKNQDKLRFQFDVADLPDGTYKVEVVSGSDVTTYPITINTKPSQVASRTITLQ